MFLRGKSTLILVIVFGTQGCTGIKSSCNASVNEGNTARVTCIFNENIRIRQLDVNVYRISPKSVEGTETAVSVQDNDTSCTPVTVTQPDLYVTDCEITPHCVADIPNVTITIAATQPVIDERNTNGLGASFTNTPSYSRKDLRKRLFSTKRKNTYNAESVTEESRLSVQFLKSQIEVNNLKKIKLELQIALLREKGQTTAAALK